jgi:hypothetical protein
MGFPLYECDAEFPERILSVLREKGFSPETLPLKSEQESEFPKSFSFRIKRGLSGIRVSGSEENGQMGFFVVFDNSANPLSWRPSAKLAREIESIMLQNGARLIEQEALD